MTGWSKKDRDRDEQRTSLIMCSKSAFPRRSVGTRKIAGTWEQFLFVPPQEAQEKTESERFRFILSSVLRPLTAVLRPLSAVCCPLSSVLCILNGRPL